MLGLAGDVGTNRGFHCYLRALHLQEPSLLHLATPAQGRLAVLGDTHGRAGGAGVGLGLRVCVG